MVMPSATPAWTAAMVRALPPDRLRHEVVDGEHLVTPSPSWSHQRGAQELFVALHQYLQRYPVGEAVMAPADVELDPWTLVQPDLFVVPRTGGPRPRRWEDISALLLVIEVLSPGTARSDRGSKRRRYQREGIPEYWIVDLDARVVERWRPGDQRPEVLDRLLEWRPDGADQPLCINLPDFFTGVLGGA